MKAIKLGNLLINKIHELDVQLPMPMMLSGITSDDLTKLKQWHWSDELSLEPEKSALKLSMHSYLLQVNGLNILIDTCNGNNKSRSIESANMLATDYLNTLKKTGVTPEEVNFVLCTHLHCDHVGWNTRLDNGEWVATFPNARYIFSRKDYEFFIEHQNKDIEREPFEAIHFEGFNDSVLPVVKAGLAEIVESDFIVDREIGNGVWLESAQGHSPGSCIIIAQDNGPKAVFSGDIINHPVQVINPDAHFFADEDPQQAVITRKALLAEHVNTDSVIFPAHFMAGHLITSEDGNYCIKFVEG